MGSTTHRVETTQCEATSDPSDEALNISESRYQRLFETAQDGILIIDAENGHITDANPFLVDLLGYEREDFMGMALWNFGPFKDIRASQPAFQELIHEGYIRYEHLPLETKDGRRIEVEFISNTYHVGQQRTTQCNICDNSHRKKAEDHHRNRSAGGPASDTRRRVFEPFFTTHFPGRGLGMASVYGTVKNHDGWISIDSQIDQGITVCIYLPAFDPKIDRSMSYDH